MIEPCIDLSPSLPGERRHAALFRLDYETIFSVLLGSDGTAGYRVTGLPAGVRVVACSNDFSRGCLAFRVEGEALVATAPGEPLPLLDVQIERVETRAVSAEDPIAVAEQLGKEITAAFAACDLLHFVGRDLRPGETSADRVAACQRLAEVTLAKMDGKRGNVHEALREALEEANHA